MERVHKENPSLPKLEVLGAVFDGSPFSRRFVKQWQGGDLGTMLHPVVEQSRIRAVSDPDHLVKRLRNFLYNCVDCNCMLALNGEDDPGKYMFAII